MSKIKVAVLFGGRSVEHEVSCRSAETVTNALKNTFDVFPIAIAKDGQWYGPIPLESIKSFKPEQFTERKVTVLPHPVSKGKIYTVPNLQEIYEAQVFFPILHGTFGEDGTIQGLLDLMQVPYVGGGVLASSMGMDKLMMKSIFAQNGLPQVAYRGFERQEIETDLAAVSREVEEALGYPCFIKPYNMGSSVGISKANNEQELVTALQNAIKYARKVIVEKGVTGREVEVAVLGNERPDASLPGEIVACNDFYDYSAKYIDDRSSLLIPAPLEEEQIQKLRRLAVLAHQAVDCAGLSRVDFFISKDQGEILINEINTLPGFTSISMYPKLWENSGIALEKLTARLVELALERAKDLDRNITIL